MCWWNTAQYKMLRCDSATVRLYSWENSLHTRHSWPVTVQLRHLIVTTPQITVHLTVCSIAYSGCHQRNESCALLPFVRKIHRAPMDGPHIGPVTRNIFCEFKAWLIVSLLLSLSRCMQQGLFVTLDICITKPDWKVFFFHDSHVLGPGVVIMCSWWRHDTDTYSAHHSFVWRNHRSGWLPRKMVSDAKLCWFLCCQLG